MKYLRAPWRSIRAIRPVAWGLAILSASLQISCFPIVGPLPYWRGGLCWIALVPLLIALLVMDREGKRIGWAGSFGIGYCCGVLTYLGNCYWIYQTMYLYGGLPKPVALSILILFSFYLGLYHALFACLLGVVKRLGAGGALAMTPILWVTVELARARVTALPWDLLGYAQVNNLLLTRIAPVAGVMGISFVIACVNAGITGGFLNKGRKRKAYFFVALVVASLLQVGGKLYSPALLPTTNTVTLLQENLSVGAQRSAAGAMNEASQIMLFSNVSLHPQVGVATGAEVRWVPGRNVKSDVVVWPEAPSLMRWDSSYFLLKMGELARQSGGVVIAGSIGFERDPKLPRGFAAYDSASFFDQSGVYRGRYDKVHLVPWGEYVPYKQFFSFAANLTEDVGDIDAGTSRTGLQTGGHTYGVFICYESIFGDEIRHFVKNGADVLVNISDDGWYEGTGAPYQHLDMTRMRAIENDRFVLQSTNTGVTTVIDPYGRADLQAPRRVRGAFALPFAYRNGMTFYTRHGDWFALFCAVVALCGVCWTYFGNGRGTVE